MTTESRRSRSACWTWCRSRLALVAGATSTIRLGSGGVRSGHRTALSVVEEFGLVAPPSRPPGTSGARRTGPWSPTGPTPSSSGDRVRSYELLAREWLG